MKIRQGGSWVDVSTYIRKNNQWVFIGNFSDANELLLIISATTTNLNLQTSFNNTFGSTAWTSTRRKRVVINSGVIVGATNSANNALTIPSGLGGSLSIENRGSIQGAGGAANSGTGGNAILANSPASINNLGTIYAGGGGGGQGGTGGVGTYTADSLLEERYRYDSTSSGSPDYASISTQTGGCTRYMRWGGTVILYQGGPSSSLSCPPSIITTGTYRFGSFKTNFYGSNALVGSAYSIQRWGTTTVATNGGSGGSGGVGQGYNQSASDGSPGTAGGTDAGTGGVGGSGGGFGADGSAGSSGSNGTSTVGSAGSPGGLAGFYIVNNGNITWTNLGTVAGRVI